MAAIGKTISEKMMKHVGGPVGDAASAMLGKKIGGAIGNMAGSLASAGIGAAIGVGIQLIGALLKKSGSEVNNNLTKDIQNPFSDAVGKLHDAFMEANSAGTLTLKTAIDTRLELTKTFLKFTADSGAYAAQSDKHALAVRNMFATIEQYWGKDLGIIFGKMDDAIIALGGSAGMTSDDLVQ